jgi:hypothetical protein
LGNLIWLIILILLPINVATIYFHKIQKLHFVWSGPIIVILAVLLGIGLVKNSTPDPQGWGGMIEAGISIVVTINGICYLLVGFVLKLSK